MPKLFDRVKVNTATVGTGDITFGAATSPAFLTPAESGAVDTDTARYVIVDGTDFEEGIGTIKSGAAEMERTTVTRSKIGGTVGTSKINLSGTAVLAFTASAADILNPENNLADLADAPTALTNLGGTTVGKAVFTAANAAAGRTTLGVNYTLVSIQVVAASGPVDLTDIDAVIVEAVSGGAGGGGAGGGGGGTWGAAGGGSSGQYGITDVLYVSAVLSATVSIGAAGAGGTGFGDGGSGGDTTWNDATNGTITWGGGRGGNGVVGSATPVFRQGRAAATSTNVVTGAQPGGTGLASSGSTTGGNGGSNPIGQGGLGGASNVAGSAGHGQAGSGFGAGGGGGAANATGSNGTGGGGTIGWMRVYKFKI